MTEHNTSGGLTEGERKALAARIYAQRDLLPSNLRAPHNAFRLEDARSISDAIGRSEWLTALLADRLKAVQAERDDLMALAVEDTRRRGEEVARAESAEAENTRLRARLEAVEALAVKWEDDELVTVIGKSDAAYKLRAALDSPTSHTQQEGLAVCELDHGGDGNPARVYGHHASPRTCIRIKKTNEWVYDPAWENNDD